MNIYQGLKVIDQKLGGCSPSDVIIDLDEPEHSSQGPAPQSKRKATMNLQFDDESSSSRRIRQH